MFSDSVLAVATATACRSYETDCRLLRLMFVVCWFSFRRSDRDDGAQNCLIVFILVISVFAVAVHRCYRDSYPITYSFSIFVFAEATVPAIRSHTGHLVQAGRALPGHPGWQLFLFLELLRGRSSWVLFSNGGRDLIHSSAILLVSL